MHVTADFLAQAQAVIDGVFKARRPELLAAYGNIDEEMKADNSPVTALDKQLEHELREALMKFDSSIGFEGEELGKAGDDKTFWLIDPIDGTESFVRGLPYVRHMATLIADGQPVYTYIYKPITDELYVATAGHGAFKNGEPVRVSRRRTSRCWLEFAARFKDATVYQVARAVEARIAGYRMLGDFPLIAEGKLDGLLVYKSSGGDWDYAPRALLLKEAGAKVANLGSDAYDYRNHDFLAANPAVFDELMPVITEAASL